jgi:hypothetical protein
MSDQSDASKNTSSDVRASIAWGQLLAGSIISGCAIWRLALTVWNLPLSETMTGLLAAYEQVRNILMLPFELFQLNLTASEKDCMTVSIVIVGAFVRTAVRYSNEVFEYLGVILIGFGFVGSIALFVGLVDGAPYHYEPWLGAQLAVRPWIDQLTFFVCLVGIFQPIFSVFTDRWSRFLLLNLLATTISAGGMLLATAYV